MAFVQQRYLLFDLPPTLSFVSFTKWRKSLHESLWAEIYTQLVPHCGVAALPECLLLSSTCLAPALVTSAYHSTSPPAVPLLGHTQYSSQSFLVVYLVQHVRLSWSAPLTPQSPERVCIPCLSSGADSSGAAWEGPSRLLKQTLLPWSWLQTQGHV